MTRIDRDSVGSYIGRELVLTKFLGICPFLGVSKKLSSALGMSGAVVFVMAIASAVTWLVNKYLLEAFGLTYFRQWHSYL